MTDPVEGLLEDVTEMTRQAAVDGLTLGSVYADVRLVLDLDPSADLPPEVLRACAVAWSSAHRDLDRHSDVLVLGWDELEDRLWDASSRPGAEPPDWAVLVETEDAASRPALLPPEDVLRAAADLLASRLGRAGEHVALVPRSGAVAGRVVALVQGEVERAEQVRSWVLDLAPVGTRVAATLHRLVHPDGVLGALRELDPRAARGD
ncbi:hypothetical protein [Nocardioides lianchengensis]|uniref:Uncharacterized protein n=1 Tax=Nocardioides lianchengensis TaxID=1045774 RepID=A0A1G7A1B7_9ACTN|nr:hypothetical protein [Nocardioides lianchengensis]NYG12306.1 hypothetical protein [Nocardioides lianchengensis]SDE08307.1 hypothetical protein SAMN05421872_114127 [Nocardioides lianchengensis]